MKNLNLNRHALATILVVCSTLTALLVVGCQSTGPEVKRQWSAQPIESFDSVAGKWAGLMVRTPASRHDDWVRVLIGKDGTYEFTSYRTIGLFSGHGQFTLADGKLTVSTDRGTATGSLFVSEAKHMLRFIGVMKDGTEYTAEVEPSK